MNELLQKHGCSNVFTVPEGLRELMSDISREVLREQPPKIFDFVANYLSVLLVTREHGVLAVKILDDLCDCKPSVSEHLMQIGMEHDQADMVAQVIKEEIEVSDEPKDGKEKVKEIQIIKKVLQKSALDEDVAAKVCQIARNAYRDYWYKKKLLQQSLAPEPEEPWQIAAQHTLEIYKKTKPSFSELTRATEKIEAAYRGYFVRKNILRHLKPKIKKTGPRVELAGPPLDIAESREIDLGPLVDIHVKEDDVSVMYDKHAGLKLGIKYDPMRTITHVIDDEESLDEGARPPASRVQSRLSDVISISKKSRMDMLEPRLSGIASGRQSRYGSQTDGEQKGSQIPPEAFLHKISFAQVPAEVIPDMEEALDEKVTSGFASTVSEMASEGTVVEEAMSEWIGTEDTDIGTEGATVDVTTTEGAPSEVAPSGDTENAPPGTDEVPEDLPGTDIESVPATSVPSSAPDTANTTDVEDVEDIGTSGEEG